VGDDYGGPTNLPWGIAFPNGAPPSTAENLRLFGVHVAPGIPGDTVLAVHPTQLYEIVLSLLIFAILMKLRPRLARPGTMWFLWMALAGVERFIVEIFRAKDDRLLGVISVAQVISLLVVIAGIVGYALVSRRAPRHPAGAPAAA
jgi:phosphatidylglycerol:prolipoprotein diacylglycerol transferase